MGKKSVKIVQSPCGDHAIYFHTDVRLSMGTVYTSTKDVNEKTKALLTEIMGIHGVQEASIDRYKVRVERALAVEWTEISLRVEKAIQDAVASAGSKLE